MKRHFLLASLLLIAGLLLAPPPSQAQTPVTDAAHIATTTWAEVARYAQVAFEIYQRAEQIYNQYQQITYQLQALQKLEFHSWRDVGPLFYQLDSLLREAETLTAAAHDLEAFFYATFPGSRRYLAFQDETYHQVERALGTFRVNLLALQHIHQDARGALSTLGILQNQIEGAEGHQEALEALAELNAWQAGQLSTMGQTLETIANTQIIASSYEINRAAQLRQTQSDALAATVYRAGAASSANHGTYSPFPVWMPR